MLEKVVSESVSVGPALGLLADLECLTGKYLNPNMVKHIGRYEARSQSVMPRDLHLDRPARTMTFRNLGGARLDVRR